MNFRNNKEYFFIEKKKKNIPSEEDYIDNEDYIDDEDYNIDINDVNKKKMNNNFNIFNLIFRIFEIPSIISSKIFTKNTNDNQIQYNFNQTAGIMFCLIVILLFSSLYIKDIKKFLQGKKTMKTIFH